MTNEEYCEEILIKAHTKGIVNKVYKEWAVMQEAQPKACKYDLIIEAYKKVKQTVNAKKS